MMCCALTRQGALLVEIAGTAYCKISDPEQANLAKGEQQICDDVFTIGWSVTIFWPSQHRKTKTVNTRLKIPLANANVPPFLDVERHENNSEINAERKKVSPIH